MKTKIASIMVIYILFLTACGVATPFPTPLTGSPTFPPPTKSLPTATNTRTLTNTPTLTPAPSYTPTPETLNGYLTPETLYGYPTPEPVTLPTCETEHCIFKSPDDIQRRNLSFNELYVGKYVLRSECANNPYFWSLCRVIVSTKGARQIEIWGYATAWVGEETGADLTGDGIPEIVIYTTTGAADGGSGTLVYEAGDTVRQIMDAEHQGRGTFTDLNGDGTLEFVAQTRIWSRFCLVCEVWTPFVFEYQPKSGYTPATYKFSNILAADIQENLNFVSKFTKQNPDLQLYFLSVHHDDNPKLGDAEYHQYADENEDYARAVNDLYQLTADYLLAGQPEKAQKILNQYFPTDKASEYMLAIQADIKKYLPQ